MAPEYNTIFFFKRKYNKTIVNVYIIKKVTGH